MRLIGLLLLALPLAAQQRPRPCSAPAHRQFDFWIGTWDVFAQGQQVGRNVIDTLYGGCVLREQYATAPRPYAGSSFNMYDASRGVWHQTWVDTGGLLLLIEGGLVNGAMVMEGETAGRAGPVRNRITWSPVARDSVRQHWETWSDSAGTWVTAFDGMYVRNR